MTSRDQDFRTGAFICAVGAMLAFVAVALGAFGAHSLEGRISESMLANFDTGAQYNRFHAYGMVLIGLWIMILSPHEGSEQTVRRLRWAAVFMLTGTVLFSGSLYTMALSGMRWLGAVTPIGGVCFLIAWALLAWAALTQRAVGGGPA